MSDETSERAEYVIMDRTEGRLKRLVSYPMNKAIANQISALLGLAHAFSLTKEEHADWVNNEKGDPYPVRYVPQK